MASQHSVESLVRIGLVIVAVVVFFPLLVMGFAMPMMGMMGWWAGGGPGVGLSPLWGVGMMLLFLVVLLGVGYVVYRGLVGGQLRDHDRALEELRLAYARGDLSDDEYERRRERLQRGRE